MKTYEVEISRTSYITLTIEAENKDEAEEKAWDEIASREYMGNANYETVNIDEVKEEVTK